LLVTGYLRRATFAGLAANKLRRRLASRQSGIRSGSRVCLSAIRNEYRIVCLQPTRACLSRLGARHRTGRLQWARKLRAAQVAGPTLEQRSLL
jgi:hypothetical protein